jgi:serine/threonine-protein kinase HSL1, negative regulator of Swe1 kinase
MERPSTSDRLAAKRPALAERQPRTGQTSTSSKSHDPRHQVSSPGLPHTESLKPEGNLSIRDRTRGPSQVIDNKRLSTIADEAATTSNRNSQVSTTSTASGTAISMGLGKRKTHVGPWQLGKTLGKGATGRVRLAKHSVTGQPAAVKIVSKKSAAMVQSQSMARMDRSDVQQVVAGQRTIPFGIEREVVIMKLIEHENVMHLYDVWENRGELYLVLEHVQGGELFDYVSKFGALVEEEAVRLWRQIVAGLSYCHRFGICHRDLKPENILIDSNRNIKLADFGMAALQPTGRWLNTSCGSPHYAAPEIILGRPYVGAIADIWSIGIILFAMLNGYLPFDGGDLQSTLTLVKKGAYHIPSSMSTDAANLIQRILQRNPDNRITLEAIWVHPLLKKYEAHHASQLPEGKQLVGPPPPLAAEDCGERITNRHDIDGEILRNLQTLWHGDKQEDLIRRLMSEGANMEKLFYQALLRFREEQLENYPGDPLRYSTSDYHHISKPVRKQAQRGATGAAGNHARRHSQFSIVSEDGIGKRESYYKKPATAASNATKGSYDPYRSSRTPIVDSSGEAATIVVRRGSSTSKGRNASNAALVRHPAVTRLQDEVPDLPSFTSDELHNLAHQKKYSNSSATSRSSLASSRRGRVIRKSASYKRAVAFEHKRQRSSGNATSGSNMTGPSRLASSGTESQSRPISRATNQDISETRSTPSFAQAPSITRPRKPASELNIKKPRVTSGIWRDDARKVSTELSKICEEAFNRSSLASSEVSQIRLTSSRGTDSPATAASVHQDAAGSTESIDLPKNSDRPLPETPEEQTFGTTLREFATTRRRIIDNWGESDPAALADILHNLDKRMELEREKMKHTDKRAISDPTHVSTRNASHASALHERQLPSSTDTMDDLIERRQQSQGGRATSDPLKKSKQPPQDTTIRVVSPDPMSPGVPIEPLQIRKKNQVLMPLNSLRGGSSDSPQSNYERGGYDPRFYGKRGLDTVEEDPKSPKKKSTFSPTTTSRKWSWLGKRTSDAQEDLPPTPPKKNSPEPRNKFEEAAAMQKSGSEVSSSGSRSKNSLPELDEIQIPVETRKKWFRKMFARKDKPELPVLLTNHAILQGGDEDTDSNGSDEQQNSKIVRQTYAPATSVDAAAATSAAQPIQVNQNWFAKFFHIKPASRVLVLQISKVRAKKEIVKKLKEWRKYGIRDVVVEKRAGGDVIRARVDAQNCKFCPFLNSAGLLLI